MQPNPRCFSQLMQPFENDLPSAVKFDWLRGLRRPRPRRVIASLAFGLLAHYVCICQAPVMRGQTSPFVVVDTRAKLIPWWHSLGVGCPQEVGMIGQETD